jgi:Fur family ferric uptake transcriptional regulator
MDSPKISLLKSTLARSDASLTSPRLIVFKLLDQSQPQSMADLVKASKGQLDRASLYRTINLFEELGIVNRISIGFKYKLELSDNFNHHHHHLTCVSCGRIINTEEDERLESLITQLAKKHNFHLSSHQLEIQGLCQNCVVK